MVSVDRIIRGLVNILAIVCGVLFFTGGVEFSVGRAHIEISQINAFAMALVALLFIAWQRKIVRQLLWPNVLLDRLFSRLDTEDEKHVFRWVCILAAGYFLVMSMKSVLRHYAFVSYSWDLGFFDNLIWNTSQGDYFQVPTSMKAYGNALGDHFHPILTLITPLYWLTPSPVWLLLVQAAAYALGGVAVYRLASSILRGHSLGFLFAISYFMYLPIRKAIQFDFHENCLLAPVYLWMFYCIRAERWRSAASLFLLSFTIKEHAALFNVFVALGFTWMRWKNPIQRYVGIVGALFSFSAFLVIVQWVIPHFRHGAGGYEYVSYYREFGNSVPEIIKNMLLHPWQLIHHLVSAKKISFLLNTLAPVAFLPFFNGVGILVMLPAYVLLLLGDERRYSLLYHYGGDVAPFVFLAAILGLNSILVSRNQLCRFMRKRMRLGMGWVPYLVIFWSGLCFFGRSDVAKIREYIPSAEQWQLHSALSNIGVAASVKTDGYAFPHLSQRKWIVEGTEPADEDYVIVRKEDADKMGAEKFSRYSVESEIWKYRIYRRRE